jgi:hypothetical protein
MTRRAMTGEPMPDPTFAAFQRVAIRHRLPERWAMDLIDGFAMDVEHREYRTLDDVMAYCWHVAGVVGVMMARVMGVTDAEVLRRAQDLGLAALEQRAAVDAGQDLDLGGFASCCAARRIDALAYRLPTYLQSGFAIVLAHWSLVWRATASLSRTPADCSHRKDRSHIEHRLR